MTDDKHDITSSSPSSSGGTTRRGLLRAGAAATAWSALGATSALAQNADGPLVIYGAHPPELVEFFAETFTRKTGVKVSIVKGGTGELLSRIRAEKARPQGDLLWGGYGETAASAPDLFDTYQSPQLAHVDPALLDKARFNNPFTSAPIVVIYNKKLVPADKVPRRWTDLAQPQWSGKIVQADPAKAASSLVAINTLLTVYGKGDAAWKVIEGIFANSVVVLKSSLVFQQVGRGEFPLGITYEEGAYNYLAAGVAGIAYPEDGTLLQPDGLFAIKGGPNGKAARAFIDYVLSEEAQKLSVEKFPGRRPSRVGLSNAALPKRADFKVIDYDPIWASTNRKDILARVQDIIVRTQK
jgi:iron(III) transport system substrate-binding protein